MRREISKVAMPIAMSALLVTASGIAPYSATAPEAWADPDEETQSVSEADAEAIDTSKDLDSMSSSELDDEADTVRERISAMQQEADAASDAYFKALDEKETAEAASAAAQVRIDEAQARIESLQSDLNVRAVEIYKRGDPLDNIMMLLEVTSIDEFMVTWHYLTCLANDDAAMVDETEQLKGEVASEKAYADEQAKIAQERAAEASRIEEEIEAKIADYEDYLDTVGEKARRKAQQEAIASAASGGGGVSYSGGTDIPANGSVVDYAYSRLGCPYIWAAAGPDSFDCSGLVMWCYAQVGISLPHYTGAQYSAARAVLPVSEAQPGDVLYMDGHVGICIESGGGAYIHAPTSGDVVKISTWPMFSCALRF